MEKKKAVGRQGWWFATIEGRDYPVAHKYWLKRYDYHDPFKRHEGKNNDAKIRDYVDAIAATKHVILSNDDVTFDAGGDVAGFARTTYIAVYEVEDVSYTLLDGLRFRLINKLFELKP